MTTYYLIRKSTLVAIADAIRKVKGISGEIPVNALAVALNSGVVATTASTAESDLYMIDRQTLVDIADEYRTLTGSTGLVLVSELANKILELETTIQPQKLATPIIRLETASEEISTSAILGKAILGYAILGSSGGSLPKLDTPIIRIETGAQVQKLTTPIIRIETEQPIQKLNAPVIRLEIEEVLEKLATPIIYIETEVIEEIEKLTTPYIYLEVEEQVEKLATPTITIETVEPTLSAPIISLNGDILTITDTSGLATSYKLYANNHLIDEGAYYTEINLSEYGYYEEGTQTITVVAVADGYKESAKSNSVEYTPLVGYTVTVIHQPEGYLPAFVNGVEIAIGESYTFENVTTLEFTSPYGDTYYNVLLNAGDGAGANNYDYAGTDFTIELESDMDIAVMTSVL